MYRTFRRVVPEITAVLIQNAVVIRRVGYGDMDLMALHVVFSQYLSWLYRRHNPCLFDARINHRFFDLREAEGFARRRLNR